MNIYVEYVILDNLVLDTVLLWAAAITLKIPYKKYRMLLGGFVGAICAFASTIVTGTWTYIVKTVCLIAMCITAIGFGKKLFWYILLTVAYTFVLGGTVVGLFNLFKVDYVTSDGQFYQMNVPLFVYVLAVALVAFLCFSITAYLKQVKKIAPHIAKVRVTIDKSHIVTGFCDSGNTLICNGLPVCFVTKKFAGFSSYFATQALSNKTVAVDVVTVTGKQKVTAVEGEVEANGKKLKVYLALPAEKCQTVYNLILSNEFCGGEE